MSVFQLGLIEGFYGRDWSEPHRLSCLQWLARSGYQSYIYAPKSDASLRSKWLQAFTAAERKRLQDIAKTAQQSKLSWGVGLSPLGAVHCFGQSEQQQLSAKLDSLAELQPDILAVLFDDMKCSHADLAQRQCTIVAYIADQLPKTKLIVCPSYYSFDPILEKVFGKMPNDYWQQLGLGLEKNVDVFWTGNEVCSRSLQCDDLQNISSLLRRAPTLWDNYPVNDGQRASQFLNINAFSLRDPELQGRVSAHYCNPMNQCYLSRLALSTLPELYSLGSDYNAAAAFEKSCRDNLPKDLARAVATDREAFSELGLQGMAEAGKQSLVKKYLDFDHPAAVEIYQWLEGAYRFDPACLTETEA